MSSNKLKISTMAAYNPASSPTNFTDQHDSRIWSLTQAGVCRAGTPARTLAVVFERKTDEHGNFLSESPFPLIGDIRHHPGVARHVKGIVVRAAIAEGGQTGLIHRKLPYANGRSNSWITSAESAMQSLVGHWGRVFADHNRGTYVFERLNINPYDVSCIPDVDELIDELLADYVIDRLDHPVIQKLLKPSTSARGPVSTTGSASSFNAEENDDEVY